MLAPDRWNKFEDFVEGVMQRNKIPGVSVAAASDGDIVYEGGFGFRDAEQGLQTSPDTVYGVGSVTKSFTALSIMQLAEAGKLKVDDPAVKWLPELSLPGMRDDDPITLHHFLTHSSGLPSLPSRYYAQYRAIMRDPNRERMPLPYNVTKFRPIDTFEDLMELLKEFDVKLLGRPGEFFSYSNEGFALLGAVIERASGERYASYVRDHILEPVGMTHTAFDPEVVDQFPEVTQLYTAVVEDGQKRVIPTPGWWEKHAMYSCGHLKSTVRDLTRYLELYRQGGVVHGIRVASRESIDRMMAPHARVLPGEFYGYGLSVRPDFHGKTLVGHGGGDKGVSAHVDLVVESGITAVSLANLSGVPSEKVALGALNTLLGLPADESAQTFSIRTLPEGELRSYVGTYRSGEGARLQVTVDGKVLRVQVAGGTFEGHPAKDDVVVVEVSQDNTTPIQFLRDSSGTVWGVSMGKRILGRKA